MNREELHDGLYSLVEIDQWVCWKEVERKKTNGEIYATKVPINPRTLKKASVSDPTTWDSFERAVAVNRPNIAGVGYVITREDPFTCIDLDWKGQTQTPFKDIPPRAKRIIRFFRSYTEWSPSGFGCHIWVRAKIPVGSRNRSVEHNVEIYSDDRYVTVTNERIHIVESNLHLDDMEVLSGEDTSEIEEREDQLRQFHKEIFGRDKPSAALWGAVTAPTVEPWENVPPGTPLAPADRRWTAEEAIEIVSRIWRDDLECPFEVIDAACDNDPEFDRIWRRKPDGRMKKQYGNDHSAWDMAFCNKLYAMCLSWQDICGAMREYRRKNVGDGKSVRMDYVARTIASVSNRTDDVKKNKDTIDKANVLSQKHIMGSNRNEVLNIFNSAFETPLGKIEDIKYHPNTDLLMISFADGVEAQTDIMAIRTHAAFDRILNQYQRVVNPYPTKEWPKVKQGLLDAMAIVDDDDMSLAEEGKSILMQWVSQFPSIPPFTEATYDTGGPWIINNQVHFEFRSIHSFCVSNQMLRSTEKRVILAAIKSKKQCVAKKIACRTSEGVLLKKSAYVVHDKALNAGLLARKNPGANVVKFPRHVDPDEDEEEVGT